MLKVIIAKEIRQLMRLRTLLPVCLILFVLLLLGFTGSYRSYRQAVKAANAANEQFRTEWDSLKSRNAHSAAHYGTYIFRQRTALSAFDNGLEPYSGHSYRIEAHKQHALYSQPVPASANYQRFGTLTMASVLQIILPLLLIFLYYDSYSREKEQGTLRLLLIQGASPRTIIAGKAIAALLVTALLLLPVMLFLIVQADAGVTGLLLLSYFLYGSIFAIVSICISAIAANSRQSLLWLLCIWLMWVIVLPRTFAAFFEMRHPLPSTYTIEKKYREAERKDVAIRRKKITDSLLVRYKADSVQQLPVNAGAIIMQSFEDHAAALYEASMRELDSGIMRQNGYVTAGSCIDPYLAIRQLSMALSGTDLEESMRFNRAARAYRNNFIRTLNEQQALGKSDPHGTEGSTGPEFYRNMAPFIYQPVRSAFLPSLFLLAGWLAVSLLWMAGLFSKKIDL